MPNYPGYPSWADIQTTTRENRSAEHGSLFNTTDPSKIKKEPKSPVHPIVPRTAEKFGKYPTKVKRK